MYVLSTFLVLSCVILLGFERSTKLQLVDKWKQTPSTLKLPEC